MDGDRRLRPGAGRREGGFEPKGRQVEPSAVAEIEGLLGVGPGRRDLLIEYLHVLQDTHGHLSARHLAALAEWMKLALTEVYEVATFYAHFDVVLEGETPPPRRTVRVCDGISCMLGGAESLLSELRECLEPDVRVLPAPCIGRCERAPAVFVGKNAVDHAGVASVAAAVAEGRFAAEIPDYRGLEEYRAGGGYELLSPDGLLRGLSAETVIERLDSSGLKGLGGAGFRTAQKWRLVRQQPGPRYVAVNADEGEPGTFKDRHYLESDPHRFLEGMLIAAWAVEAHSLYIYLRDEYPAVRVILERELGELDRVGLIPAGTRIELRRGAGAYICGEETAMLESIEGKRGYPRHKPPFPTQVGLFGQPTLIHNVETLYWVRAVLEHGPEWLSNRGRNGRQGLRTFSVSGRVARPGVKLADAGITVRELIEEHCGGMLPGHEFKGYLPGGASGGILPASMGNLPLDFGTLEAHGCFIGSAAVIVLSDQDDTRMVARELMRFFADESCGQCTPCRCGTEKALELMRAGTWDESLLTELSGTMRDASICGLGQAAANPLLCSMRYFPEDRP